MLCVACGDPIKFGKVHIHNPAGKPPINEMPVDFDD